MVQNFQLTFKKKVDLL